MNNTKERKRLIRYRNFLANTIKDEEFYFNSVIKARNAANTCGTVCCGFGWAHRFNPVVFKWSTFRDKFDVFCAYFGLINVEAQEIFWGLHIINGFNKYYKNLGFEDIKKHHLIAALDKYMKKH